MVHKSGSICRLIISNEVAFESDTASKHVEILQTTSVRISTILQHQLANIHPLYKVLPVDVVVLVKDVNEVDDVSP